MAYICDVCSKELKSKRSLESHKAKFHSGPQPGPEPGPENIPAPGTEKLELEVPDPGAIYQCGGCENPVSRGQPVCHKCGERLVWEGI